MLKKEFKKILLASLVITCLPWSAFAQEEDSGDDDLEVIEMEVDKGAKKPVPAPTKNSAEKEDINFSGLGTLAPFSEVSVIQKRFMPKTNRIQLFGGLNWVTNNPFFDTYGIAGKAAWFLNETWGLEFTYIMMSTSEAKATKELKDVLNVAADNLIYPKSYMGLDLMWLPIYGKFTWFNNKIVPYDMYFSLGYGQTGTQTNAKPGTLHLSLGQIFALSKSKALRWDFSWNSFNTSGIGNSSGTYNMLYLTVGMSWSFPEADYR